MSSLAAKLQAWPENQFLLLCLILAAVALFSIWQSYKHWQQRAQLRNLPRSKVRSAAQGYVELEGVASAYQNGDALASPLSGRSCLWYHTRIEQRDHAHDRGSDHARWQLLEEQISDALFCLQDETGECVIDPGHADVQTRIDQRWSGSHAAASQPQSSKGVALNKGNFRYTERLIVEGDPLFAIGHFQTLAQQQSPADLSLQLRETLREWKAEPQKHLKAFDLDKDGRISAEEWQLAVEAARASLKEPQVVSGESHLLSRDPNAKRPYVLASMDQQALNSKLMQQLALKAGVAVFALAALLWALLQRGFF